VIINSMVKVIQLERDSSAVPYIPS